MGEGFAAADGLGGIVDGGGHGMEAGGVAGDLQRVEHGDAGVEQRAEDAANARNREVSEEGPDLRRAEDDVRGGAACGGLVADPDPCGRDCGDEDRAEPPRVAHGVGRGEEELRECGQLDVGELLSEDRDEEGEEAEQDEEADDGDGDRVDARADDLSAEINLMLDELAEAVEGAFEEAALFAGADHGDVDGSEDVAAAGHGGGEFLAVFHLRGELPEDGGELRGGLAVTDEFERTEEWDPGVDEVADLGVGEGEVGRWDFAGVEEGDRGRGRCGDIDRGESEALEFCQSGLLGLDGK